MANKHVYINNNKNQQVGFKRQRGMQTSREEEEVEEVPVINDFQVDNLRTFYERFTTSYESRYAKRSIAMSAYIDLVEIRFFPIFNNDLKVKFYQRYGLVPLSYKDFNRTVLFEIVNAELFEVFKSHLAYIISIEGDVPFSGEEHNLIATIFEFKFIDSRKSQVLEADVLLTLIQTSSIEVLNAQKNELLGLLSEKNIEFSTNQNQDLYFLKSLTQEVVSIIDENIDIVETITSSRPLTVRPGTFGTLRENHGFLVNVKEDLPIVGVIDTGVNNIDPFANLILDGINITTETSEDHCGHGTLVAGLVIFGTDLPLEVRDSYNARCRVLPIKVIHRGNDCIDFPKLIQAIRNANNTHGVKLFNMSLAMTRKDYNENFSVYAFELDMLSFELDILIFISVGNFDSNSLNDLLTTDHHVDHNYPQFFYNLNSTSMVHKCVNTNICAPSESLNNISVGALAGNIEVGDNTDITPNNSSPAYYTRKYHFDFEQKVNSTNFKKNQKNKNLIKPDLVFDGGDLQLDSAGIEVLASPADNYYRRTCGTSLSSPLVASMAADIQYLYPALNTQSIKSLLINNADPIKARDLPHFQDEEKLLEKLTGHGIPQLSSSLFSDNNSITIIIEDQIKPNEIFTLPIFLPPYLKTANNKLLIDVSLCYSFPPDKGNHLGYLPMHISFNLVKNVDVTAFNGNASEYSIKAGFSWSEDHFGKENILFSNTQKKRYRLQPSDIVRLNGEFAVAVRSLIKENIDDSLKTYLIENGCQFSVALKITEELRNETESNLYSEIQTVNEMSIIGELDTNAELDSEI